MKKSLKEKLKHVKIMFMDVDGVLNAGKVCFINDTSPKEWCVRDRLGIKILKNTEGIDIKMVWISGRPSEELEKRGRELGVDRVFSNVKNKLEIMKSMLAEYDIKQSDSMYIGDDLVDLGCMASAGISCCPADAVKEVRDEADFVIKRPGGRGAVREIIEKILKARGVWENIVSGYKKNL